MLDYSATIAAIIRQLGRYTIGLQKRARHQQRQQAATKGKRPTIGASLRRRRSAQHDMKVRFDHFARRRDCQRRRLI